MNGSCRCAARPLSNKLLHSSQKSTTSLFNRGAPPTWPAHACLLHPPSPQSTALKKRVTRSCLPWMSWWLRSSPHPLPLDGKRRLFILLSPVGQRQPSLEQHTPQLARRILHYTPWPSYRSFKPNSSAPLMYLDPTEPSLKSCTV